MDLRSMIKEGRLLDARAALVEEVKSAPADTGRRTLLFQVLSLLGEWDKALRHLDMISTQDPSRLTGAQLFVQLIEGEKERDRVFSLKQAPSCLSEAPPWFEPYGEYARRLLAKDTAGAQELYGMVKDRIPRIKGSINGESFTGLADTDSVLSPFLEAFIHGRYVWIPLASIRELTLSAPGSLTDLIWIQANVTTWEGLTAACFLPVLYPGSPSHEDERIKLGRMTDWEKLDGGFERGVGQHVFQAGEKDMAILEIREAVFTFPKT